MNSCGSGQEKLKDFFNTVTVGILYMENNLATVNFE
jgi:hypothetical protein